MSKKLTKKDIDNITKAKNKSVKSSELIKK